jgi:hypothetical protein
MVITPEDTVLLVLAYLFVSILIAVAHKHGKYALYGPIDGGALYLLLAGTSFGFIMVAVEYSTNRCS